MIRAILLGVLIVLWLLVHSAMPGAVTKFTLTPPPPAVRPSAAFFFEPLPPGAGPGFTAHAGRKTLLIRSTETILSVGTSTVHLKYRGGNRQARLTGLEKLGGVTNYYLGKEPSQWVTGLPQYARVQAADLYPGVNLLYYGNSGNLEHDFVISPGADPGAIRLSIEGARNVSLNAHGDLLIDTPDGPIIQHKPLLYQLDERGKKRSVTGGFRKLGAREVGFETGAYDHRAALVIDPDIVVFQTNTGGSGDDIFAAIAADASGFTAVGTTNSTNLETLNAFQPKFGGGMRDAFVISGDAQGNIRYQTFVGGSKDEQASAIAVDRQGWSYITGQTTSVNYPKTPGALDSPIGNGAMFITTLGPTGLLLNSAVIGTPGFTTGTAIDCDPISAQITVGGVTSAPFPFALNGVQPTFKGQASGFVLMVDPMISKVNSGTYWAGNGGVTIITSLRLTADGGVLTGGYTNTLIPVTSNAAQKTLAGDYDGFVTQFNNSLTSAVYSTLIGGPRADFVNAVATTQDGTLWFGGATGGGLPLVINQTLPGTGPSYAFFGSATPLTGQAALSYLGNLASVLSIAPLLNQTSAPPTVAVALSTAGQNSYCGGGTDASALIFLRGLVPTSSVCFPFDTSGIAVTNSTLYAAGLVPGQSHLLNGTFGGGNFDATVTGIGLNQITPFNFVSTVPYPLGFSPAVSLAADFDGQGGLNDIAVIEQNLGFITILLNVGGSTATTVGQVIISDLFTNSQVIPTSATAFKDAQTGLNDIAITDIGTPTGTSGNGQIIVGLNNGGGNFIDLRQFRQFVATPGATNILNGDFNNDGFDDLAYVDTTTHFAAVSLNDGKNAFLAPTFIKTGGFIPGSAALADVNDDDNLDLVVVNQGQKPNQNNQGSISILQGGGDGSLVPAGSLLKVPNFALSIVGGLADVEGGGIRRIVDFNNDGFPDFAVVSTRSLVSNTTYDVPSVSLVLNRPDAPGAFNLSPAFPLFGSSPEKSQPRLANRAAGRAAAVSALPNSPKIPMAVADFDGDGNQDLAVVNPATNTLSLFRGDGKGGMTAAGTYLTGNYPIAVAVVDLNHDGLLDLLVTNQNSRSIQAFINTNPAPAAARPRITPAGLANAASFGHGAVSPGEFITLFGANMGPPTLVGVQLDASGKFATKVAGTQVLFDGVPAPIVYTVASQVSVIVPYEVDGKQHTQIQVVYNGVKSNTIARPVVAAHPAVFTAAASGSGQGAILNQNSSANSAGNPAAKGSVIQIFATGEGQTSPTGVDGSLAGSTLPKPVLPVKVSIGGKEAKVTYAGAAPGLVAGLMQVNAVVPDGIPSGNALLLVSVGATPSQSGVTVAVK